MRIILDPGSTHMGKWDYIKELTDITKESGADVIKWQLFRGSAHGNIEFPRELFPKAVEYARELSLDIFASCFDTDGCDLLHSLGIPKVKLAYSENFNLKLIRKARQLGMEIWASGNTNSYPGYADVKFLCVPEYPIRARFRWGSGYGHDFVQFTDRLEVIDDGAYDGFSSHYLGFQQDVDFLRIMQQKGLKYLEKHITLDHDDMDCPDHWFALMPQELKEMIKCLRKE